jgi:hypothetical protein
MVLGSELDGRRSIRSHSTAQCRTQRHRQLCMIELAVCNGVTEPSLQLHEWVVFARLSGQSADQLGHERTTMTVATFDDHVNVVEHHAHVMVVGRVECRPRLAIQPLEKRCVRAQIDDRFIDTA